MKGFVKNIGGFLMFMIWVALALIVFVAIARFMKQKGWLGNIPQTAENLAGVDQG